jgi:Carboxypeptidase regulatory-like domain
MRLVCRTAWAGLCLLALAVPAGAQELRGRITGVVTDNSGAPVPGVTVAVSSPALIQPQATTTSADGTFRFPALPSGVYTVAYELAGFQSVRREGIRVSLNSRLSRRRSP